MRIPSHAGLCSFICSAILTSSLVPAGGDVRLASAGAPAVQAAVQSALTGLRAQGFAGSAGFALPAPTAAPAAAPLAPDSALPTGLFPKILTFISMKGKDRETPPIFANALGFSAAGAAWSNRQGAASDARDGSIHSFAVSRGTDQDVLLSVLRNGVLHAFRAHRDGTPVSALSYNSQTQQLTMRAPAEAKADLDAEYAFWNANIDALIKP